MGEFFPEPLFAEHQLTLVCVPLSCVRACSESIADHGIISEAESTGVLSAQDLSEYDGDRNASASLKLQSNSDFTPHKSATRLGLSALSLSSVVSEPADRSPQVLHLKFNTQSREGQTATLKRYECCFIPTYIQR